MKAEKGNANASRMKSFFILLPSAFILLVQALAADEVEDGVLDFVDVLVFVDQDVVELLVVGTGDAGGF